MKCPVCQTDGIGNLKFDEAYARVVEENTKLREALRAYNYYFPMRRSAGCAQGITTLSCGHVGQVGAPCCRDCAVNLIKKYTK